MFPIITTSALIIILLSSVFVVNFTEGLEWETERFQYITGCVGATVTLPWRFRRQPGEAIDKIYWRTGSGSLIASRYKEGGFMRSMKWDRIQLSGSFGPGQMSLDIESTRMSDSGYYTVTVAVEDGDGKHSGLKKEFSSSIVLVLGEAPSITGKSLTVQEVTSQEPCPRQAVTSLRCGRFDSLGFPPIDVVWTDPSGNRLPSSRFVGGYFYLDFADERLPGNYSCQVTGQAPVMKCLESRSPVLTIAFLAVQAGSIAQPCPDKVDISRYKDDKYDQILANVTTLHRAVISLKDVQAQIVDERDSKEVQQDAKYQFLQSQVEELQATVRQSNHSNVQGKDLYSRLSGDVQGLQNELLNLRLQQVDQQFEKEQDIENLHQQLNEMRNQRSQDLEDVKESILASLNSLSLGESLSHLSQTVSRVQEAVDSLHNRQDGVEDTQSQHHLNHSRELDQLWRSVALVEELLNSSALAVEDVSKLQKVLQQHLKFQNISAPVRPGVDPAVIRRLEKENSRTQQRLWTLQGRLNNVQGALDSSSKEQSMKARPDPLISKAVETFSVTTPQFGQYPSLILSFALTASGRAYMVDSQQNKLLVVADPSVPNVTVVKTSEHVTEMRHVTSLQNEMVAVNVYGENLICVLDTGDGVGEDGEGGEEGPARRRERWVRTATKYMSLATRSRQTLFAGVSASDSSDGVARIDLISIAQEYVVTVGTLLRGDVEYKLKNPAYMTLHEDRLYISDLLSHYILRLDLDTLNVVRIAGPNGNNNGRLRQRPDFLNPGPAVFDVNDNMYVSTCGDACDGKQVSSDYDNGGVAGEDLMLFLSSSSIHCCVVVASREGRWKKLLSRGAGIVPSSYAITPTGLAVSWVSSVQRPVRSEIQWYDLQPPDLL